MGSASCGDEHVRLHEKQRKLLTQEVPGQCGSCSNEEDDEFNEDGQETLAGPSLSNGQSHRLSTGFSLWREETVICGELKAFKPATKIQLEVGVFFVCFVFSCSEDIKGTFDGFPVVHV